MTGEGAPVEASDSAAEPEWKRRRRLAALLGDVLPDQTGDDVDPESSAARGPATGARESASDKWLREQVPPHHG